MSLAVLYKAMHPFRKYYFFALVLSFQLVISNKSIILVLYRLWCWLLFFRIFLSMSRFVWAEELKLNLFLPLQKFHPLSSNCFHDLFSFHRMWGFRALPSPGWTTTVLASTELPGLLTHPVTFVQQVNRPSANANVFIGLIK